jgi:tetratricopeptide (TPR) repeat protein
MSKRVFLVYFFLILMPRFGQGCGWDYDTIAMESQKMPEARELISGYFLRHSPEFYYWRIKDRESKIKNGEDKPSYYDDIAWAFSKIERQDEALSWIEKKEQKWPGLYETYANWGTVLLFKGEWEQGLKHLKKAIAINPDAHFGREIFQIMLVEYVLSLKSKNALRLPLAIDMIAKWIPSSMGAVYLENDPRRTGGFQMYYRKNKSKYAHLIKKKDPIEGFKGMMRFASFRSPILLETFGDLLSPTEHLSSLAYLKAAREVNQENVTDLYRLKTLARIETKSQWVNYSLMGLEDVIDKDIEEAETFYQKIRSDEISWILSGENPELNFEKKYYGKEYRIQRPVVVRNDKLKQSQKIMKELLAKKSKLKAMPLTLSAASPLEIDKAVKAYIDK